MQALRTKMSSKKTGFTLVEIMIVVLIIGILLAIAIPNFVQAREASRAKACTGNLKQIDSAKQQCAMDNKLAGTDTTSTFAIDGTGVTSGTAGSTFMLVNVSGGSGYIRSIPICPSTGTYTVGNVSATPLCSISSGVTTGDYGKTSAGVSGRFYHGL